MKYESAELREQLAAEYVLGTMPRLTRRRFERLVAEDPTWSREIADWTERFVPVNEPTPETDPPAHVWRAIERHVQGAGAREIPRPGWLESLALWRGIALAATAAAAALMLYVTVSPAPSTATVVAVLNDSSGEPGWLALSGPGRAEISIAATHPLAEDASHSFELWGIAAGEPRPLGLLHSQPDRPLMVRAALVPPVGAILAVSVEPANGSPTGLPTGPVLYKGNVLNRLP